MPELLPKEDFMSEKSSRTILLRNGICMETLLMQAVN